MGACGTNKLNRSFSIVNAWVQTLQSTKCVHSYSRLVMESYQILRHGAEKVLVFKVLWMTVGHVVLEYIVNLKTLWQLYL